MNNIMSSNKPFYRQSGRKTQRDRQVDNSFLHDNFLEESEKIESKFEGDAQSRGYQKQQNQQKTLYSSQFRENLRRWSSINRVEFLNILWRQRQLKSMIMKESSRLKLLGDPKIKEESDQILILQAFFSLYTVAEEISNEMVKMGTKDEKPVLKPTGESKLRMNQQKEMNKQIALIDQQISQGNWKSLKIILGSLLKRFSKDEYLESKMNYLVGFSQIIEEFDRQQDNMRQVLKLLDKLSKIEIQNSTSLSNMRIFKRQIMNSINRETKRSQSNATPLLQPLTQIDILSSNLIQLIELKTQKKDKTKKQGDMGEKRALESYQEIATFTKDLLTKSLENKEDFFKQLDTLKRNKKKSMDVPYSLFIRFYEIILASRKEVNDAGLYLKASAQIYQRKNLTADLLGIQLKKCDQKYNGNQILGQIKPHLDIFISNVKQRERLTATITIQNDLKNLKKQNDRLEKALEVSKGKMEDNLKKLEILEKQKIEIRIDNKDEKDLQRVWEALISNIQEKRYKQARNSITMFLRKYEGNNNIGVIAKTLSYFGVIGSLLSELQGLETLMKQGERKVKSLTITKEKELQILSEKNRQLEQFEDTVLKLIQMFNSPNFSTQNYFEDLRKDRKKIVQQRFLQLMKLQEPLINFKRKPENESNILTLSYSDSHKPKEFDGQIEARYKQLKNKYEELQKNKIETQEVFGILRRMEKGGEWWKSMPKSKSSNLKPLYDLLEHHREQELELSKLKTNFKLGESQQKLTTCIEECMILAKEEGSTSLGFWNEKIVDFKNEGSQKLAELVRLLAQRGSQRLSEERKAHEKSAASYEAEIQKLTNVIGQLERSSKSERLRQRQSRLDSSSSKKSAREGSRSRDTRSASSLKLAMQEYIQEQKTLLNRIQSLEEEKIWLEKKLSEREKDLKLSEENINFLNKQLKKIQEEKAGENINELWSQLSNMRQALDVLRHQVDVSRIQQNQLKGKLEEVRNQLQSSQIEGRQWKQGCEELGQQLEMALHNLESEKSVSLKLEQEGKILKGSIPDLKRRIQQLQTIRYQQDSRGQKEILQNPKKKEQQFNERLLEVKQLQHEYFMREVLPFRIKDAVDRLIIQKQKQFNEKLALGKAEWQKIHFQKLYQEKHQRQCDLSQRLIREKRVWEQEKEVEWKERVDHIEDYWLNNIIPEVKAKDFPILLEEEMKRWEIAVQSKIQALTQEIEEFQVIRTRQNNQIEALSMDKARLEQELRTKSQEILLIQETKDTRVKDFLENHRRETEDQLKTVTLLRSEILHQQESLDMNRGQIERQRREKNILLIEIKDRQVQIEKVRTQSQYYQAVAKQQLEEIQNQRSLIEKLLAQIREKQGSIDQERSQKEKLVTQAQDRIIEIQGLTKIKKQQQTQLQTLILQREHLQERLDRQFERQRIEEQARQERTGLLIRIGELQRLVSASEERQAILMSLQRQLGTADGTLRAREAELVFLKRTLQGVTLQLGEAKDQLRQENERALRLQRQLTDAKNELVGIQFERRYHRERDQVLNRKLEGRQAQLLQLRKKSQLQYQLLEAKLKTELETSAALQLRFTELDSKLTLTTLQTKTHAHDLQRLRGDLDRQQLALRTATRESEGLKNALRQATCQGETLLQERKVLDEQVTRLKMQLLQAQSSLREMEGSLQVMRRGQMQWGSNRKQLQRQLNRLVGEVQARRLEGDKWKQEAIRLNSYAKRADWQAGEVRRQAEDRELEALQRIDREVEELTAINRQLEARIQVYEGREEEMRRQASQVVRVRDQLRQLVEAQLESENDQMAEEYRQVLNDVKTLLREYLRTGESQYLQLICRSLSLDS